MRRTVRTSDAAELAAESTSPLAVYAESLSVMRARCREDVGYLLMKLRLETEAHERGEYALEN